MSDTLDLSSDAERHNILMLHPRPFTLLDGKTPEEVCVKHHRKPTSYYPISPRENNGASYNPICVNGKTGYIDLITPTTFGTSTIVWDFRAQIISGESLEMVLNAHHRLMGTIDAPCPPLQLVPSVRQRIAQIGESILHASRTEVLNKQDTERMVQEIITACDVLPPSPVPSPVPSPGPSSTSASSGTPEKVASASTSSGSCKEKYPAVRKPEDDRNGGDGPSGSPKRGGKNRKSRNQGSQQTKSTENKSTSASSSKPQDAVESLEVSECSEYGGIEWNWELVESDQEQVETTEEFGELEWTWDLLDSESEIDDSDISEESGSGLSSPVAGGPTDIAGWLQDLQDDKIHSELTEPPIGAPPILGMEQALTDQRPGEP